MDILKATSWPVLVLSVLALSFTACDGGSDDPDGNAGSGGTAPVQGGSGGEDVGGSGGDDPGGGGTGGEDPGNGGTGGEDPGQGGTGGQMGDDSLEFTDCTTGGEVRHLPNGGKVVCDDSLFGTGVWLRSCDDSSDCKVPTSFCVGATTNPPVPFCILNYCGKGASFYNNAENGELFDSCNPVSGYKTATVDGIVFDAPSNELTGTCLPVRGQDGKAMGFCHASGTIATGRSCDPSAMDARNPGTLCKQGAECSAGGTCFEVCDATERSRASFARCSSSTDSCMLADPNAATDAAVGFCQESGGPACVDFEDTSPACEACVEDAAVTCTNPGGSCRFEFELFESCAEAAGCRTNACAQAACPDEVDEVNWCILLDCAEFDACFF